jgi:hypothetical protein
MLRSALVGASRQGRRGIWTSSWSLKKANLGSVGAIVTIGWPTTAYSNRIGREQQRAYNVGTKHPSMYVYFSV